LTTQQSGHPTLLLFLSSGVHDCGSGPANADGIHGTRHTGLSQLVINDELING
jgi:hypothetical protein